LDFISESDFGFFGVGNEGFLHGLVLGEELALVFTFLGVIMGLVFEAQVVGAKCWDLTRGPKHLRVSET
jgi:hypothetical protein